MSRATRCSFAKGATPTTMCLHPATSRASLSTTFSGRSDIRPRCQRITSATRAAAGRGVLVWKYLYFRHLVQVELSLALGAGRGRRRKPHLHGAQGRERRGGCLSFLGQIGVLHRNVERTRAKDTTSSAEEPRTRLPTDVLGTHYTPRASTRTLKPQPRVSCAADYEARAMSAKGLMGT